MKTADSIDDLSKTFLDCRDRGHAWFDARGEPSLKRSSGGLVIRVLVCSRCRTRREDVIIGTNGAVDGRRYVYPEGYCLTRGVGYAAKDDVRKLAVRAAFAALKQRRTA
jgi:hypothetical protein